MSQDNSLLRKAQSGNIEAQEILDAINGAKQSWQNNHENIKRHNSRRFIQLRLSFC